MGKPVVYFTKTITPETILALYKSWRQICLARWQ